MLTPSLSRMIALAVSLAILTTMLGILSASFAPASYAAASPVCVEDDPCFRWDMMGNRERGIYIYGRTARVIVSPCGYARLHARINWTRTPRVRGDYSALHARCAS